MLQMPFQLFLTCLTLAKSEPKKASSTSTFLHLEEQMPDFDQIIHVTIDPKTCLYHPKDSVEDLILAGATFIFPEFDNLVSTRVGPWNTGEILVNLLTFESKDSPDQTECKVKILEEIHCVVVPDSFANCPTVQTTNKVQ